MKGKGLVCSSLNKMHDKLKLASQNNKTKYLISIAQKFTNKLSKLLQVRLGILNIYKISKHDGMSGNSVV